MKIQRYTCGNGEGMFDDKKGYWVTFKDHEKEVNRLKFLLQKIFEEINIADYSMPLYKEIAEETHKHL